MGWGGQEVRVLAELEWMRAHGHWVALAAHPESEIAKKAKEARILFYPLDTRKAMLPIEVLRLTVWLGANRVEIVNTHSSNDGWLAGTAAHLAAHPLLIRSRHIEVEYPDKFWSGVAFRIYPHHVITTSQRIANRLIAELDVQPTRITCVPTGVDLEHFKAETRGKLHKELRLAPNIALVGMISVLRSWKGHATFLDAAAAYLIRHVKKSVRFVIAGDGPGRETLEEKITHEPWKDHVTLLGHRTDVPSILASLDALVLPSYAHEGIPQIILQAQAMSCPVIATTVGGIPEVVQDGVTGLLVPPRDSVALTEKISALLNDPQLCDRLTTAARKKVEKYYSLDAMGNRLLEIYEQCRIDNDPTVSR